MPTNIAQRVFDCNVQFEPLRLTVVDSDMATKPSVQKIPTPEEKARAIRLTKARVAAKYSNAKEFYSKFGINQSTYTPHESAARGITKETAQKYARYLGNGTTAGWLMYGQGDPPIGCDDAFDQLSPAERREQEFAAFMLLFDRITALAYDNEKTLKREFNVVFQHYGYDVGERGIAQMAFHIWWAVKEENSGVSSLVDSVMKEADRLSGVFDALKQTLRQIQRLPVKRSARK